MAEYQAKLNDDENSIGNYVYLQYKRMGYVNGASALNTYLEKSGIKTMSNTNALIFPFDFNISQKVAIENAFNNQISVIEGPPGCGKTQTILNFIANAVMQNKKVAIVSNNNTAIQNIIDKLAEKDLSFFCALLGNKDNKTKFFEKLANDKTAQIFFERNKNVLYRYFNFREELELLENLQNSEITLKSLYLELQNTEKEYEHFKSNFKICNIAVNQKLSSAQYKILLCKLKA
jgi:DNA polymerase III delta prime subunit